MNNIIKAINFAEVAHRGQFRKNGITPYIVHPLRVYSLVTDQFLTDDSTYGNNIRIASILHDVIEDSDHSFYTVEDAFGSDVAQLVWEVTKEGRGKQGHKDYCIKLKSASEAAQTIKYADIIDNVNDLDFNNDRSFCKYFFNKLYDYLEVLPKSDYFYNLIEQKEKEFNEQTN